jgi:hypothetical protein
MTNGSWICEEGNGDGARPRSNRGRARTSAMSWEREHANAGYRPGPQQLAEQRARKKHERLVTRLAIQDELYDMCLAANDAEIWSFGADLTTHKDLCGCRATHYATLVLDQRARFSDPREWDDWHDWIDSVHDEDRADDDHNWDEDWHDGHDDDDGAWEPRPTDPLWVDLWIAGHVDGSDYRDDSDYGDRWSDDLDDLDALDDLANPLLAREGPGMPVITEAVEERALERHRAGERYFRQHKRVTRKTIGRAA